MKLTAAERRIIDPIRETEVCLFPVRKFTVREYHRLMEVGILLSGDPYELLRGWIVPKVKRSPRCASSRRRLERQLRELFADDSEWMATTVMAVTFRDSETEPAAGIARGPGRRYEKRHPHPTDTELVIECSARTLDRDRGIKLAIYARGLIPTYWIVNIPDRVVEVYTQPRGGKSPAYRTRTDYAPGTDVPVVVRGTTAGTIPAGSVLPG